MSQNTTPTPETKAQYMVCKSVENIKSLILRAVEPGVNPQYQSYSWVVNVTPSGAHVAITDWRERGREIFGHYFDISYSPREGIEISCPCMGAFNPNAVGDRRAELYRGLGAVCDEITSYSILAYFKEYHKALTQLNAPA